MNLKSTRLLLSISHVVSRYRERQKNGLKDIHFRILLTLHLFGDWTTRKDLMLFFKKNSATTNYQRLNICLSRLIKSKLVEERKNKFTGLVEYKVALDGLILLGALEKEIRKHRPDKTAYRIQSGQFKKTSV